MKLISNLLLAACLGLSCAQTALCQELTDQAGPIETTGASPQAYNAPKNINLSQPQLRLLTFAHATAVADGHKHPELLLGLLMRETRAGEVRGGKTCFGISQLKLGTARSVLKMYPELLPDKLSDKALRAKLIHDDEFNIRVASKYLLMMGANISAARGVTAYNLGEGAAKHVSPTKWGYTKSVLHQAQQLKNAP
jgi:hypothetical protein